MTKEELLNAYLSDNLIAEKKYLNGGKPPIKWSDKDITKLVTVLKLAIEGEISGDSSGVTVRKINQLLNS